MEEGGSGAPVSQRLYENRKGTKLCSCCAAHYPNSMLSQSRWKKSRMSRRDRQRLSTSGRKRWSGKSRVEQIWRGLPRTKSMHGFLGGRFAGGKCIAFISAAIERSIKGASRELALALDKLRYDVALVAKGSRGTQNSLPCGKRHVPKPSSLERERLLV